MKSFMNEHLSYYAKKNLKFSSGWLENFQRRSNLKYFKSHGESGDANNSDISKAMTDIRGFLKLFELEEILNAEDFGRF